METPQIAVYIRVSTDKQNKNGNGLSAQLNGITEYCKYKNYVVKDELIFVDGARSAKNLNRPAFQEMYDLIKSGLINKVIIYKRDRIVRDMMDLYFIRNEISQKYTCTIESVQDGIIGWDTGNEMFMQNIYTAKDNLELIQVSERTKDCLYASALKGNYTVSPTPKGYKRCTKGIAKKAIKPNPKYKDQLVYAFNYIDTHDTKKQDIISHFNSINLLDITWTSDILKNFVSNKIYSGIFVTPSFEIIDHSPSVINIEMQERVIKRVCGRKRMERRKYIFRDYLYCTECGNLLSNESTLKKRKNRSKKHYLYYSCPSCNKRINESILLDLFGESFVYKSNNIDYNNIVNFKKNLIQKLENCVIELSNCYLDETISKDIWISELSRYKNEIKLSKEDLVSFKKESKIISFSQQSMIGKRKLLSEYIEKIDVSLLKMSIKIKYKK